MKYILMLLLASSIYGAGFWTLSGVDKANIYVQNNVAYLKASTVSSFKTTIKQMLEKNAIKTGLQDAPTLMLTLEEIDDDETHYVYIKLQLGEEVTTHRTDASETFAITFEATDFIETDLSELDESILESVEYLMNTFIEQYEDDKE